MVQKHAISWFEIPVKDLQRAQKFYETILEVEMQRIEIENIKMSMFPVENMYEGIGGALVDGGDFYKPSLTDGPLVYLNANPDVQNVLGRVEAAGGKILSPKTEISPEYGYMAMFEDAEGNRIALHSVPEKYLQ